MTHKTDSDARLRAGALAVLALRRVSCHDPRSWAALRAAVGYALGSVSPKKLAAAWAAAHEAHAEAVYANHAKEWSSKVTTRDPGLANIVFATGAAEAAAMPDCAEAVRVARMWLSRIDEDLV